MKPELMDISPGDFSDRFAEALMHYGKGHEDGGHSGRYPWGSGDNSNQRSADFLDRIEDYKRQGMTDSEIQETLGMTSTEIKSMTSICLNDRKAALHSRVIQMHNDGMSNVDIGKAIGKPESTVRNMLRDDYVVKRSIARTTADTLKKLVDEKGYIDVGKSTQYDLGVSKERMQQALLILADEGYNTYPVGFNQVTNAGKRTRMLVLTPPGTQYKDVYNNPDKIQNIVDYTSDDGGDSFHKAFVYPSSIDFNRIYIRRPEEGGSAKDGVIELRRGVEDISLGESHYAQVRVLVDNGYYMKGMAVYGPDKDFPPGKDVIFNTHYTEEQKPGIKALKEIKRNPDGTPKENPFGSLIKPGVYDPDNPEGDPREGGQSYYIGKDGKKHLSAINKKSAEGDWESWSDHLPSQFLSKQPIKLIESQLAISKADRRAEYDEIMALENPVVRKKLLLDFAETCDKNAVSLQAAALPGQKYQVLLPLDSLPDGECYCPRFKDGDTVALIRYPHGGTFEIPICRNNLKNPDARKIYAESLDAIAINSKTAAQLSGADFDGDTVMVIPCNSNRTSTKIVATHPLKDLEGFDNKLEYGYSNEQIKQAKFLDKVTDARKKGKSNAEIAKSMDISEAELVDRVREAQKSGVHIMKDTQKQMGVVSNLICDMTLKGADEKELARAVKHSMVVIDAEKHGLDFKRSEIDNDIAGLKKKYQRHYDEESDSYKEGASTLISRAKSQRSIDKRQGSGVIDKETGEISYKTADDLYYPDRKIDRDEKGKPSNITVRLISGKKISYDPNDAQQVHDYEPIKDIDISTGEVTYHNRKGDQYRAVKRVQVSTAMAETKDAMTLSSGTAQEAAYGDYANYLKSLANLARKEAVNSPHVKKSASAAETYADERESLLNKLLIAEKNQPKERKAQTLSNAELSAILADDPNLPKKEVKKLSQQILTRNRLKVGAKSTTIDITPKEWNAIQAGAISENQLSKILMKANPDQVREYSSPKKKPVLSVGKQQKIVALKQAGYPLSVIAESVGVSSSTVSKFLKEDKNGLSN